MARHLTIDGVRVHVAFVCRYREINTYEIDGRYRVSVADDGSTYSMPHGAPVSDGMLLTAVAEYERHEHADFVKWASENGYPVRGIPHAVCLAIA